MKPFCQAISLSIDLLFLKGGFYICYCVYISKQQRQYYKNAASVLRQELAFDQKNIYQNKVGLPIRISPAVLFFVFGTMNILIAYFFSQEPKKLTLILSISKGKERGDLGFRQAARKVQDEVEYRLKKKTKMKSILISLNIFFGIVQVQ